MGVNTCQSGSMTQRKHSELCGVDGTTGTSGGAQHGTSLPQIVAPADVCSPQLTGRARKYRRITECSDPHFVPDELPVIMRPVSSRSASAQPGFRSPLHERRSSVVSNSSVISNATTTSMSDSDSALSGQSGRRERRFACHQDLFATVLTPRSRSVSKSSTGSSRAQISLNENVVSARGSAGSHESSSVLRPVGNSGAGSRRPSNAGVSDEPSQMTMLLPPAVLSPCTKISPRERQHAYKALRLLVFGSHKAGSNRDKLQSFDQEIGTEKQSLEFFAFWIQIDPDMTGKAEFNKFMGLLNRLEFESDVHRCYSLKLTSLLVSREIGMVMIEDLMEAIWPERTAVEKAEVWQRLRDEHEKMERKKRMVPVAPPVLNAEDRTALECIFTHLGGTQTRNVSFHHLAAARDECGLLMIDSERLHHYIEEWNIAENEGVSLEQFLVMMCPAGFRAFGNANLAIHESGTNIIRSKSGTWYMQSSEDKTVS